MRFLHLSDVHLGFQQYGLRERFMDFGFAFDRAISYGVQERVDAILIAGDLFHKAVIEPSAYLQATQSLRKAREIGISVIAIEGNHDQARYQEQNSWLDVLNSEGYLILLRSIFSPDPNQLCALQPWDVETRRGAYIDIQNVRVVGLQWLGASISALFPDFSDAVLKLPRSDINFTVLLTHAALEGEIDRVPIYLGSDHLQLLSNEVQYLALGHLHKPFEKNDWAYNPGSLEVYDFSEVKWNKGWYDVDVGLQGEKRVSHIQSKHRPFFSERFAVDMYTEPQSLYRAFLDTIRKRARVWTKYKDKPIIEIQFTGVLGFDRAELNLKRIEEFVREEASVCHVVVNATRMGSPGVETILEETLTLNELELSVLRQIAESDSRFSSHADLWANCMLEIKRMALIDSSPDDILETLQAQIDLAGEGNHVD